MYQDGDAIVSSSSLNDVADAHLPEHEPKEHGLGDWYAEGPGRRVGYDDLTAIDWTYEYAKERQRMRVLHSTATGILGYVRHFVDASQIWIILILTGLSTGIVAALIDIASDWLGDLKTGICVAGEGGGRFHLNRGFCCWGLDEISQCADWHSWGQTLHITSQGGSYTIGYVIFVALAVCL